MIGTEGVAPEIVVGIHRPVIMGRRGVVATGNHLATLAAMKVLMDGGNAVDAAVTAAGVLAVVMPQACGIGGDAFMQVYDAKSRKLEAINGSGAASALATPDRFPNGIPQRGVLSASVPGAVDAWATALERHGTISLKDALQPAIFYAEEGFPLTALTGRGLREQLAVVKADPGMSAIFLRGGEPIRPGQLCVQRDLARALRLIAEQGRDAFYCGEIAHVIERFMGQRGGLVSRQDLAAHATQVREPVRSTYRGLTVSEQPPVSVGVILLEALNILEGFDLASLGHNSPEAVHLQVEAIRLAFAARARLLGDPDAVQIPLQG
ncbi:MAG: gamma-glutamyltransferase, partial [Deltaproteobacteria bacterium]|nr:gamma-glutamyltransferase [Deltaproteobacteria bacterium]